MSDVGRKESIPTLKLRLAAVADQLRGSLWFVPTLMVLGALGLAAFVVQTRAAPESPVVTALVPNSVAGARALLQVIAASVITVVSVVFSLTLVALQISATNYSPRVLRTFLRDRGTQVVLGTFLATFAYTVVVLEKVEAISGDDHWTPQIAVALAPLLAGLGLAAFVYFIHHVTQSIRVETILRQVLDETLETIDRVGSAAERCERVDDRLSDIIPDDAIDVRAQRDGFVQSIAPERLVAMLEQRDLRGALRPTIGDHVLKDTVLGWVWGGDSAPRGRLEADVVEVFDDAVHFGPERTMQQDIAFGLRQLVDVAVRALSPGVNDPNTAATVVAYLGVAYTRLAKHNPGHAWWRDDDGEARLLLPSADLDAFLHIAVQQISHYGRGDPMVLQRLLRMLGDVKSTMDDRHHDVFEEHVRRVVEQAEHADSLDGDISDVREAADLALAGAALRDHPTRSG